MIKLKYSIVTLILILIFTLSLRADTIKCPASRDVWLSAYPGEEDFNMGVAKRMKLKVFQEFAIVDFDTSSLKGQVIDEAWLYIKPVGVAGGPNLKSSRVLRWLTVSTIGHDWVEGKSHNHTKDTKGLGATWNESSYGTADWGWKGSVLGDVAFGNCNSIRFDGKGELTNEGWLKTKLTPAIVQSLVCGASYGLLLQDGNGSALLNGRIASRETTTPPYLLITTKATDTKPPAKPRIISIKPYAKLATDRYGAISISLTVPDDTFTYRVKLNNIETERWQIPIATGKKQTFTIVDQPPNQSVEVKIIAVDAAGNESAAAASSGRVSAKLSVPDLPKMQFTPQLGAPKAFGQAKVWAFPEVTKVDPITGDVKFEESAKTFRQANPVWDGKSGTIRIAAAKGEIISFQVAVEGKATGCHIAVSPLKGGGTISNRGVKLWRNWYVGRESEYALPLTEIFDCPSKDNNIAGQTVQAVTIDYHIPIKTSAGSYKGTVTLTSTEGKVVLPLIVRVYNVTIPDEIFFNPELNCYGGPGKAGSSKFKNSHKLAHYNRCNINRVPYNQSKGDISGDLNLKVDSNTEQVLDWSALAEHWGPLFDGSLFNDNPRKGVPIPTWYIPINIGWPVDYLKYYKTPDGVSKKLNKDFVKRLYIDLDGYPIEQALSPVWRNRFKDATHAFANHATKQGWNKTIFEFYCNRKWKYGYSIWTLDEPVTSTDFLALRYFGKTFVEAVDDPELFSHVWHDKLFKDGLAGMNRKRATVMFRTDISRPVMQGNIHDGITSISYINSRQFDHPRLMRNHKERAPMVIYCYGSCNAVQRSNWESVAWCLKSYANHCDGVLPWQSLAKQKALTKADQNGLIIDTTGHLPAAYGNAVASFRVHALRRGAQDCELLRLLQLKNNWSREQIGMLIEQKISIQSKFNQKFSDEAAAISFSKLDSQRFCELREGILQLLEQ